MLRTYLVEYSDKDGVVHVIRTSAKSAKNAQKIVNAAGISHADVISIEREQS